MRQPSERANYVVRQDSLSLITKCVELEYQLRTPKSATLHEKAKKFLPGGDTRSTTYFPPYPLFMASGAGCRMTDVDGNGYIDFVNNYTSLIHGHAHPKIVDAVSQQILRGTVFGAPLEVQAQLAEVLCKRVQSLELVRFCNSGTEAMMNAVRTAKAFTGRNKIIKMEGGYHGTHDMGAISVRPAIEKAGPADAPYSVPGAPGLFEGVVNDVIIAPFNDVEATSRIIDRHHDDVAAVILEPVLGAAGMIPAESGYLRFLREATQSCGALLIFDEVITFRLAYGGAQEIYGIMPDLTAMAKIVGGGFPVGAFGGREDIMSNFDPQQGKLYQSGTFNGNAITMTAGLVALELLTRDEITRINRLGEHLREGLRRAALSTGIILQVTGVGSLTGIHFTEKEVRNYRSAARDAKELHFLHLSLLNQGIYVPSRGDFYLSTAMSEAEIDAAILAFHGVLEKLKSS